MRQRAIGGFPFRIEVRCAEPERGAARQGHAARAQGRRPGVLAQVYQPTLLIARVHRPDDGRRAGTAAGLCGELDARPIEHARHAAGAAARLAGVRRSDRAAAPGERTPDGPQRQAHRAAWPHRRKARPTTIRCSKSVLRATAAAAPERPSARGGAARCRRRRDAARARRFRAETVAGALPGIAGARRPHRHRQCARAAGRGDRGQLPARSASPNAAISTASCR